MHSLSNNTLHDNEQLDIKKCFGLIDDVHIHSQYCSPALLPEDTNITLTVLTATKIVPS